MATAASNTGRETRLVLYEGPIKGVGAADWRRCGRLRARACGSAHPARVDQLFAERPFAEHARGGPVSNWLGGIGAWTADLLLSLLGPARGPAAARCC
jgi:hypothetical protein